jgi:hypothetical protein
LMQHFITAHLRGTSKENVRRMRAIWGDGRRAGGSRN